MADEIPLTAEAHRLEHQHRKQGADGVDDDPLPAQDTVHLPGGADYVEHGGDHRRARYHQHSAEHGGDPPVQPQQEVTGAADDGETDQHAGGAEIAHHLADPLELGQMEGQRPLEQDDGYRQGDQRKQQIPEQGIGVEQAADRAQSQAGEQQKQDGGYPQRPGKPLGQHGDQGDPGQREGNHADLDSGSEYGASVVAKLVRLTPEGACIMAGMGRCATVGVMVAGGDVKGASQTPTVVMGWPRGRIRWGSPCGARRHSRPAPVPVRSAPSDRAG